MKKIIIDNEFSRRNLSVFERVRLALAYEELIKQMGKENMKIGGVGSQISTNYKIDTRIKLAEIGGVSTDAIKKVKKILDNAAKGTIQKISTGEITINEAYNEVKKIK